MMFVQKIEESGRETTKETVFAFGTSVKCGSEGSLSYPSSCAFAMIFSFISSETPGRWLNVFQTVTREVPRASAISCIVTFDIRNSFLFWYRSYHITNIVHEQKILKMLTNNVNFNLYY